MRLTPLFALLICLPSLAKEPAVVRVHNWTDYIDESVLAEFSNATGIQVEYSTFESAEALEAKLAGRNSGYDVVVPSANFLAYARRHKLFRSLNKAQIPNLAGLDPQLLRKLERSDPSNAFGVPYLWGTTVFAYRAEAISKRLGSAAPVDSWRLLMEPAMAAKLADCGIGWLDSGTEVIPELLRFTGSFANSLNPTDYLKAEKHLKQLLPHIRYFGGENLVDDLSSGKLCAAYSYSGDLAQAREQALANGITDLTLVLPKEGAEMWVDLMAIPVDAPHPDNAHAFINYLLQPAVIARISNTVSYPNAVPASLPLIDDAVKQDPVLFPSKDAQANLYTMPVLTDAVAGISERIWVNVRKGKTGQD